ncbi:MAG: hypothetical protein V2A74_14585 [bacterium]
MSLILDEKIVNLVLLGLAALTPLVGFGLYIARLIPPIAPQKRLALAILIGVWGPLLLSLWLIFNKIMDAYGLDSVKGLLINVAIFLVVGLVVGVLIRWIRAKEPGSSDSK